MSKKMPPYVLRDFSAGLNDKDAANLIPDNALVDVQNAILGRGFISKRHGYVKYTPSALANPITKIYEMFKNNGTKEFLAVSNKTLYQDSSGTLNFISAFRYLVLEDCEDAWDQSVDADVTSSLETVDKKVGNGSVKLVVADLAAAGDILATEAIPSTDISSGTHIRLWIKSSVMTAAGDLQLLLDDTASAASPVHTLNIPALPANTWTQVEIPYDGTLAGSNAIISVGLKMAVDIGAFTVFIDEVEAKIPITLTDNSVQMMSYKDRSIQDVTLIADTGKLKTYNSSIVQEVKPHTPNSNEATNPGANDLANLTNFRALAIKKDRVFAAAHPTVKNRLSFCHRDVNLGYAVYDYWPASFFFDVATDENDEIVQLATFRDGLLIFCKRTSPWILYGDGTTLADYTLHKINTPAGCIAPDSVVTVGNNIFYLSEDHVYSLFATDQNYVSAQIVSQNIENTLKDIPRADKEKAVGYFFDNKYYLAFPSGTCLVFDTLLQAWTKWTNIKSNSFLERDGVLYFGADTGLIYNFDETVYNDDGTAISFSMTTKNMDFGFQVQVKKYKRLWTVAKQYDVLSSSFTIKAVVDYVTINITDISTDQSGVWDEGNWDTVYWDYVGVVQDRRNIQQKGKSIQLIVSNSNAGEPVTLYGLVLLYKLKKPK